LISTARRAKKKFQRLGLSALAFSAASGWHAITLANHKVVPALHRLGGYENYCTKSVQLPATKNLEIIAVS
jgi:hypothetical protein